MGRPVDGYTVNNLIEKLTFPASVMLTLFCNNSICQSSTNILVKLHLLGATRRHHITQARESSG